MAKIAMIGAGSVVFCKTLMMDIMATEALRESTIVLMNRTNQNGKLDKIEEFAMRVVKENNLSTKIVATLDRKQALKDADYVINMIQVGGADAFQKDYQIPMKYGVDQCIGDTMGPGGIFRALRTIPVVLDIAHDMEELCPNALLLNYANPMAMVCWALGEVTNINFVGLCHGVQTTLDLIARYVGVDKEDIDYLCAGINHLDWFLKLKKDGKDLYPLLRNNIEKPEYYINEYCSYIIEAIKTGKIFKFSGNVRNDGLIANLPSDCCVEVSVYVDGTGLHPTYIGDLPPQCAALCMSNIIPQDLAIKAALSGDFEYLVQVIALDPLTSAVLTLKEVRDMAIEMYQAQKEYLPEFNEKKIRKVHTVKIPEGTKGVKVPLDPALAIAHRFGELEKK